MENEYYVYVYLDPRKSGEFIYDDLKFDYEPFYVGKGKNLRYKDHLKYNDQSYKTHKIKKILKEGLEPIIIKIKENLTNEEAFNLEIKTISQIGRFNVKQGPLTNVSGGGDGAGIIAEETKEKLRKYKGDKHSQYIKLPQEAIEEIIGLYKNKKMYASHIGEVLNLNENKIKSVLLENNIHIREMCPTNKILLSDEIKQQIIDLYVKEKLSMRNISKRLNVGWGIIQRYLYTQNIATRDNTEPKSLLHRENLSKARKGKYKGENNKNFIKLSEEVINKVVNLRKKGLSYHKIMKETGLKYTKVYKTIEQYANKI